MKIIERNLQEIGQSLLVTLPKEWTKALKLKKGSNIKIGITEHGTLTIAPEMAIKTEHKEAVMPLDKYFTRRFFKEYFGGNDKITFTLDSKNTDADRKRLYDFLRKFMNIQIIEETKSKIVIKAFKIDDLSIQECLNRMYFLSLNIFEELSSDNDNMKKMELDETITRFYYMLVMQVRRYLEEGKYLEENRIPLILAMDYRMVAEKMERIADIAKNITDTKYVDEAKTYYSKAYNAFKDKNFDSAMELLVEYTKKYEIYKNLITQACKKKDMQSYNHTNNILQILKYSKEISMLVR